MNTKKKLIVTFVSLAVIGCGVFAYTRLTDDEPTISPNPTQAELDQMNAADQTPDTEKDTQTEQGSTAQTPQSPTSNKKTVTVSISEASSNDPYFPDMVVVRALVDQLEDGTCTATFTKGSIVKTYTVNTEQQASTTQCDPFQIPKSDFSSGTWKLKVVFESPTYKGEATGEVSI